MEGALPQGISPQVVLDSGKPDPALLMGLSIWSFVVPSAEELNGLSAVEPLRPATGGETPPHFRPFSLGFGETVYLRVQN
jgi:hypothetical protein